MDYSQITEALYVGDTPRPGDYDALRALGVSLVINMRVERPPYRDRHNPPMRTLWLPTFDSPLTPIPVSLLRRGTRAALKTIEWGGKVYTHCAEGVHRSVAMAAAILIAQGHTPEAAMQTIKQRRPAADPDAWHILRCILRFAEVWRGVPRG